MGRMDDTEAWRRLIASLAQWSRNIEGASEGMRTIERDGAIATVALEATDLGRPVYERLGYRSLGEIQMWERRAAA